VVAKRSLNVVLCGLQNADEHGRPPGPDLNQDSRAKIAKSEEETRKKHWDLMS
jgi:hypothetical protein